jgi:hypothetical protein
MLAAWAFTMGGSGAGLGALERERASSLPCVLGVNMRPKHPNGRSAMLKYGKSHIHCSSGHCKHVHRWRQNCLHWASLRPLQWGQEIEQHDAVAKRCVIACVTLSDNTYFAYVLVALSRVRIFTSQVRQSLVPKTCTTLATLSIGSRKCFGKCAWNTQISQAIFHHLFLLLLGKRRRRRERKGSLSQRSISVVSASRKRTWLEPRSMPLQ